MNKAFVRNDTEEDDDAFAAVGPLSVGRNYISVRGYRRLYAELKLLLDDERPKLVETIHWAAGNGDRSENGDYLYGKKRLREIDRRIRFLTKRLQAAEVVDPSVHFGRDQVFFGARVLYEDESGHRRSVTLLGVDEFDSLSGEISWISPVASALLKAQVGDTVRVSTPGGQQTLEIIEVLYPTPEP